MKIGVDEAGIGPVMGSMFATGIKCEESDLDGIPLKDSKKLSKEKIFEIGFEIYWSENIRIKVVEGKAIDFDKKNNNTVILNAHTSLINSLFDENSTVFVDACSSDENKWKEQILNNTKINDENIIVENKADENYDVVKAASIISKFNREIHVNNLKKIYGDFGSGYPSDKTTVSFLEDYYSSNNSFPDHARKTWSTCSDIKQKSFEDFS